MSATDHIAYSVAIRTLGLNPGVLRAELESVFAQTLSPDLVVVYIAEGYKIPDFRVGNEIYVRTKKGMQTQRALDYKEISSPYILLLDDDVLLAPDSASRMVAAMAEYDCVAPDVFGNHKMPLTTKLYAALSNLTLPHYGHSYALKIHANGSFSYLNAPKPIVYPSQSASGPASMWRKKAFLSINAGDELWLERLGFPYGEDQLLFYKLHKNGGRLGLHYGAGVVNNNAQTSSGDYHRDPMMLYKRARAQYLVWHRSVYSWRKSSVSRLLAKTSYMLKVAWQLPVHMIAAVRYRDIKAPYHLIKGTIDGIRHTKTPEYSNLPPYIL